MTTNGQDQPKQPLFQRIKAQNLLSFGPEGIDLELGPLNVLIGPNGSGKSNLLDVFSLFQAAPREIAAPIRQGGGIHDWIWRGDPKAVAHIFVDVAGHLIRMQSPNQESLRHELAFFEIGSNFRIRDERILSVNKNSQATSIYLLDAEVPRELFRRSGGGYDDLSPKMAMDKSILAQLKDPLRYSELSRLSRFYDAVRLYRNWPFGRDPIFTSYQSVDVISRPMAEDFSNAWIFLNRLTQHPSTKARLIEKIADIYDGVTEFGFDIQGSTVGVFLTEGQYNVPVNRLSDGTIRYICLLAILLDPEPPPFIAIEEPELGIHPDLMPRIVDLMIDASSRTQLVVTTHNDTIVDALNDRPESIIVCEKHDGQTEFNRLDRADLKHWLDKYRLGDLWVKGALGGTRW